MSTTATGSTPVDINTVHALLLKMDASINSRLDDLCTQMQTLKSEVRDMRINIDEQDRGLQHIDNEVSVIKVDIIPNLKAELQTSIADLQEAKLSAELYSKKSNLLFFNIPQSTGEDTEQVLRKVISKSTVPNPDSVIFMNVHRLPSRQSSGDQPAPIIGKFVRMKDRDNILNTISKAAIIIGTKRVGVAPHLPAPMQAERKRLVPIRNKLKAEGKNAKIKVSGIKVQLLVNGNPIKV